jgi:hypothetical protein
LFVTGWPQPPAWTLCGAFSVLCFDLERRTTPFLKSNLISFPAQEEEKIETCYNCGLPADRVSGAGVKVVLHVRPQSGEKFKREHRQTAWCHDEECAIQALAVARYGPASHKWPITLAQFRAMNPVSCNREDPFSVLPGIQASEDANPKRSKSVRPCLRSSLDY